MHVEAVIDRLTGTWEFDAWYETDSDGSLAYRADKETAGKLIYTADGHVSAQLAQKDVARLSEDDDRRASEAESATAWKAYFGYFGTWSVDVARQVVIHHIEGAWFPNLIGTDQLRRYRFEGERLLLDADTAWGRVGVVWKRPGR